MAEPNSTAPDLDSTRCPGSMSATPAITDSFSAQRREMLQDFANITMTADAGKIADLWLHHYSSLAGARGLFCVKEQRYDKPDLPENRDFGGRGFLRSWMASKRLLLIRDCEGARERRYSAPIFCGSNFVSYCEAFCGQRSLSQNSDAFRDAVAYLLPRAEGTSAFPYMVENAENPDREKVRATLRAFAAFKLTSPEYFASHGRFLTVRGKLTADDIADGCLEVMGKADFRTLHTWVKDQFLWFRIVLIKAALARIDHTRFRSGSCGDFEGGDGVQEADFELIRPGWCRRVGPWGFSCVDDESL
jgi:hypothetical protein